MALRNGCSPIGRIVRLAAVAFISASALSLGGGPADAHRYRHFRHVAHYSHATHRAHYARYGRRSVAAVPASPAFSAIVVDANSGRTLYSADENGLRHPASITKVMTLYLLFEQLEKGAMTLHTQIPISEHAAAQEPSKLGVARATRSASRMRSRPSSRARRMTSRSRSARRSATMKTASPR